MQMKKQSIITIICFGIVLFGGLFAATQARAAVYYVTTTVDRDGTCVPGNCSLREAVKAANATTEDDSIFFDAPLQGQTFYLSLGPALRIIGTNSGRLTISAAFRSKTRIHGGGEQIFVVRGSGQFNSSPGLELNNLVLTGGVSLEQNLGVNGGAIRADDTDLKLNYVDVINNTAASPGHFLPGGGIYALNTSLTILNSRIHGNTGLSGGGISVSNPQGKNILIVNTSFVNNKAVGGVGSGFSAYSENNVTLRNITMSGNQADNGKATIYLSPGNNAVMNLENTTIAGNTGAALDCNNSVSTCFNVRSSIFYNNTNPNLVNMNVSNSIINTPDPLFGALVDDGISPAYYPLTAGSPAIDGGENILLEDIRGVVRGTDGDGNGTYKNDMGAYEFPSLVKNAANGLVGSLSVHIQQTPANGEITFDPAYYNQPRTITNFGNPYVVFKNLNIIGPGADLLTLDGENTNRLFVITGANLKISGIRLTRGKAVNDSGGAVYINSDSAFNGSDMQFYNNRADIDGGALLNAGTLNLTRSNISGNSSSGEGGGIKAQSGSITTITDSTVANNTSNSAGGGGIANFEGNLTVTASTLSGNTASNGGGVFVAGNTTVNNSTLSGNIATTGNGGAFSVFPNSQLATTNTTITNNRAATGGGVNITGNGVYLLRNTIIAGNTDTNTEVNNCPDVFGTMGSFGYNLIGSTTCNNIYQPNGGTLTGNILNPAGGARLAPLGNYGGATQTHALFPNSPAINAGDPNNTFTTDQRGALRPVGGRGDIGSFEQNITINPTTLPNGFQLAPYDQTLTANRLTSFAELLIPEKIDFLNSDAMLAPFTYSIFTISGQMLPPGLTLSSGGVLSGTPTTSGTFTFTVQATDADGIAGLRTYTISIAANTLPTISAQTISRQQGSPVSNSQIATVNDAESGAGGVTVAVTSANPSNGVTVSNIINTNGTITANVIADCAATNAVFTLSATDTAGTTATSTLTVNVSANTAPVLSYPANVTVNYNQNSFDITPTATGDNGTVTYSIHSVSPVLPTAPTVNAAGVISIVNAQPAGTYLITVRATDNCGAFSEATVSVLVNPTVTKIEDTDDGVCDADCSLREAVGVSPQNSTITFSPLFDQPQTITVNSTIGINRNVKIDASGKFVTVSGGNQHQIFKTLNCNVTFANLTLAGGRTLHGGAIFVSNQTVTLINTSIIYNFAQGLGGGIHNNGGTVYVINSTIAGNFGGNGGGGIFTNTNGTTVVSNSTITGNSSGNPLFYNGGGINNNNGNVTVRNSIIAGNSGSGPDFQGTMNSQGYNLIGDTSGTNIVGDTTGNIINQDARLAPLASYGGTTHTSALLADSPAVNAGNPAYDPNTDGTTDQRGSARVIGGRIDIGAFERNIAFDQTSLPNGTQNSAYNQTVTARRLTDNAPVTAFSLVPEGAQLPAGLSLSSNGTISGTPTVHGSFTFSIKATDTADNLAGAAQYTINIASVQTISVPGISRQIGSPVSNSQIAVLNNFQNAGGASVELTSANPSNGITISNIVNTNGTITADVIAACGASGANFNLTATDTDGTTATATLTVNVTPNTAPTLSYPAQALAAAGGSLNVAPTVAADNGTIQSFALVSQGSYTGGISVNVSTGEVSITNAQPLGNHVITIRAADNCGAATETSFLLTVRETPTQIVTKIADTYDGICDADCSLREAIGTALAGDSIEFAAPLFDTAQTIALGSELVISKNLTVNGRGANLLTLDGQNAVRGFNLVGSITVSISNLRITRGYNSSEGGAILSYRNQSPTINLSNVTIDNSNSGGSGGGAISTNGGNLSLTNVTIDKNNTTGFYGGGIYCFRCNLDISNSRITRNNSSNSSSSAGGGIAVDGGRLQMTGSVVSGNTTSINGSFVFGGGLYLTGGTVSNRIENSVISNNTAKHGGGIYSSSGFPLEMSNVTVSGNSAVNTSQPSSGQGGGIFLTFGVLRNCTIAGNSATGQGGGIRLATSLNVIRLTLANTIVGDNAAPNGADISSNSVINISSANIIETPIYNGGGSYAIVGTGTIIYADPRLAPLSNYGGASETHALLSDSPALNAGSDCVLTENGCGDGNAALLTDQRGAGAPRKIGAAVDIGAFEQNVNFDQTTLPEGSILLLYDQQLSATRQPGFSANVSFAESSNSAPTAFEIVPAAGQQLPPGLTLSSGGRLSGEPMRTGTYTFTVKATDTDGMAGVQEFALNITGPLAANLTVSGRVLTPDGSGLVNAFITLTDTNGNARTVQTSSFGHYKFEDVAAGQTYFINIRSRRYQFTPRILNVMEDIAGLDFTADP